MENLFSAKMRWVQMLGALGIVLFWIYFFALENSNPPNSSTYLAYERSFPLPDLLWVTPLLVASAWWSARGDRRAVTATIASGGALVFLGLVDFAFNLQQGIYAKSLADAILNAGINAFCVFFGFFSVVYGGRKVSE